MDNFLIMLAQYLESSVNEMLIGLVFISLIVVDIDSLKAELLHCFLTWEELASIFPLVVGSSATTDCICWQNC